MIVVVGEALIDRIDRIGHTGPNDQDEIQPVEHVGGSPLNVAVALARLGHDVTLGTTLGDDAYGTIIRTFLEANAVDLFDMIPAAEAVTSVAHATLNERSEATYRFDITWSPVAFPSVDTSISVVHSGSLATALAPGATAVLAWWRRLRGQGDVLLTYDPNIRPALLGSPTDVRSQAEEIVSLADVVKVSSEDLMWLYPDRSYDSVAEQWLALGPALVAVTVGAEGAHALTKQHAVSSTALPVSVVDTVGAGDAFMAGMLHALLCGEGTDRDVKHSLGAIDRQALSKVVALATRVAGMSVGRAGADPPHLGQL